MRDVLDKAITMIRTDSDVPENGFVFCFATWCPHCQRMILPIEEIARENPGKVFAVDVDYAPKSCWGLALSIPTYYERVNGEWVNKHNKAMPKEELLKLYPSLQN